MIAIVMLDNEIQPQEKTEKMPLSMLVSLICPIFDRPSGC